MIGSIRVTPILFPNLIIHGKSLLFIRWVKITILRLKSEPNQKSDEKSAIPEPLFR